MNSGNFISISTADGDFNAYIVRPEVEPAPAVVVVQEIFGINDDLKATCRELAESGFIAVCPDLFWRLEPGFSLSHWTDEEWKRALELYTAFDIDAGARDVKTTLNTAAVLPGCTGKVGVMGYCLGGLMTFLVAARYGVDAAVEYYGGRTDEFANEGKSIRSPMLIHLGEEDEFISPVARAKIKAGVSESPSVTVYSYPGCSHAFARHTGTRYDAAAAKLANDRTWRFLAEHLR